MGRCTGLLYTRVVGLPHGWHLKVYCSWFRNRAASMMESSSPHCLMHDIGSFSSSRFLSAALTAGPIPIGCTEKTESFLVHSVQNGLIEGTLSTPRTLNPAQPVEARN